MQDNVCNIININLICRYLYTPRVNNGKTDEFNYYASANLDKIT